MHPDTRTRIATTCLALTAPSLLVGTAALALVIGIVVVGTAIHAVTGTDGRTLEAGIVVGLLVAVAGAAALVLLARLARRTTGAASRLLGLAVATVAGGVSAFGTLVATTVILIEAGVVAFLDTDGHEAAWGWPVIVLAAALAFAVTATGAALLSTRPARPTAAQGTSRRTP